MNRMADVAAMYDLELGERFRVRNKNNGQLVDWVYYFDESGLHCENDVLTDVTSSRDLDLLLRGEYEIVRERWKPSKGDNYYSVDIKGKPQCVRFDGDMVDLAIWAFGNCFKTAKEVEAHADEMMAKFDAVKEDIQIA